MPESIFEFTDGQSSENLTTEILHYILVSDAYAPYQRLFYSRLFPSEGNRSTDDYGFSISTQVDYGPHGRPDLVIENEKRIIVIENKFYAGFSFNDQMLRYFQYLDSVNGFDEKYLVLLTIRDRASFYHQQMVQQFSGKESFGELMDYFREHRVFFKSLIWDDILNDFDSNDFIISNLKDYIQTKYLTSSILVNYEMEWVNDSSVPELLEMLWDGINKIKVELLEGNYDVQKTSQSRLSYGFSIEEYWGKIAIQIYHIGWYRYKAPYLLHIRRDWFKDDFYNIDTERKLGSIGFFKDSNFEYVFPIKIKEVDNTVGYCIPIIHEKIDELREIFEDKYQTENSIPIQNTQNESEEILEENEMEFVNDSSIPELFEKLWSGVSKIRDYLADEERDLENMSQSRLFYGFKIVDYWGKAWFGFGHFCWLRHETPYYLQIRKDWINDEFVYPDTERRLEDIGFIEDEDLGLIFPIKIEDKDVVGFSIPIIRTKLEEFREMFKVNRQKEKEKSI
jgi:hypothetical protein